jgi:hypothetical protein
MFAGSESYWSSQATTAFAINEPAVTPAPTQQLTTGLATSSEIMMYIIGATIAIIIAIAVVGLLIIRKRP